MIFYNNKQILLFFDILNIFFIILLKYLPFNIKRIKQFDIVNRQFQS